MNTERKEEKEEYREKRAILRKKEGIDEIRNFSHRRK